MKKDWIDYLSADEARKFMQRPIATYVLGKDSSGRPMIRQVEPISFRDLSRINEKANQA